MSADEHDDHDDHDHPHGDDHDHDHPHGHDHDRDHPHGHDRHEAPAGRELSGRRAGAEVAPLTRGQGAGKLLFLDAFSGLAGDMLVAALLDLGVPGEPIHEALEALPVRGYRLGMLPIARSGIHALRFVVEVEPGQRARSWGDIRAMLEAAPALSDGTRQRSLRAFSCLAQAEARVHRVPEEEVHFHEVGAVDSIVDMVAAAAALDWLGALVECSPLPMGRGFVRADHGTLPLPAPAVLECLRGVPTYDAGIEAELVTPTGAALAAALASRFTRWPELTPLRTGWGAGTRELPDRPNLLRVVLGDPAPLARTSSTPGDATHVVIEANVDDMSPEISAWALERLLETGALDAWTTPLGMKKGRPAVLIGALCSAAREAAVARTMLAETSSLGVRVTSARRHERPRRFLHVATPWGAVKVKVADGDGLPPNVAPEHDDCARLAREHAVPLKSVYAAALSAAWSSLQP